MRDAFCHSCGTKFPQTATYPRTCTACKIQVWANPIPVAVGLVPIVKADRTGLLVVRRAIPPGVGKLALVGGFLEEHETWQVGCAREVREETGVVIDPATVQPMSFVSTEPKPNRVLLFGIAAELQASTIAAFTPNAETAERGVIFGPGGLDEVFAFSLHADAAREFFAARGISGSHSFAAI